MVQQLTVNNNVLSYNLEKERPPGGCTHKHEVKSTAHCELDGEKLMLKWCD